jgi:hypothetical protein
MGAAEVFAITGDDDAVLEELDQYLSGPGEWSVEAVAVFPRYKALHDDPRFQELMERHRRSPPTFE